MRTTRHFIFIKHFIVMLLCALLCVPATPAQDRKTESQANNPNTQDVTIIIQQQQVRFTARSAVEQMQLQVFNQSGELTFDSGLVTVNEINWPFQNANSEAIKSGLYAYTLSIKEAGVETARVRRGHFIVDRAQDRDGADKLWVTSRDSSGIGTELTVARDENGAVAGATTSSERALELRGEGRNRGVSERGVEAEAQNQTAAAQGAAAITAGTVGKIAKFTSATELGNSVMTEANGNVGIGTTATPSGRLHIVGSAETAGTTLFQPNPAKGPNASHVHWGSTGDWYIRSAAATGKVVLQDSGGSVSIGAATPIQARLYVFNNNSNAAMRGENYANGNGVAGSSDSSDGVSGVSRAGNGVRGLSVNSYGVFGQSSVSVGVFGKSSQFEGVRGESSATYGGGVVGYNLNTGIGVYGQSDKGIGVQARSVNGTGVDGGSTNGIGVYGISQGANGFGGYFRNTGGGVALNVEGRTRTGVLEITGGADFAENFDININVAETASPATTTKVEAGMVVSIDPTSPGKLQLSSQAYDRRVAGIISGAGGVKPGMMMSQTGTLADGQHPVALSGRVYCYVDASQGAIEPGDLLTTASTPGHAMKVADAAKAQGAIIGKAMTGLKEGKGLVLVLVTLQ
jgi:hypothetical protein